MEKDTSFLFAGITFDRKKFAHDFARFQEKKESDNLVEKPKLIENGNSEIEEGTTALVTKKRKRKAPLSDPVKGFNLFKSSKSKAVNEGPDQHEDDILQGKKEYHRQLERDAIFRKTHNIHVSGSNIPSPLHNFAELRSRYICRSYLLRNLAELGFKEPTPIQRQAIPVLLSGRECFACAPTGSGKTFAFVCPILMKLKVLKRHFNFLVSFFFFVCVCGGGNSASESIKQKLIFVGSEEGKLLALRQSFAECLNPPVLLFVQNKERAKELYNELKYDEIRADVIHADLSQIQRENAVDNFRSGKTWVLIATDVIARGMDFKGVNCVINYDFPDSAAAYIHRIGRSGRAGRSGEAITLYTEADVPFLRNVANVMTASGCEVPSWIMSLRKKKWRKHRPQRESIFTKLEDEEE
ncbi:DEAD-box ATP-dependent RNA helicase 57 [Olea europaea subsp. europaea]|uniref:RNA helicase n=1 Tax=Olea europaea subsp. europaea TaxID=158383 RepID=A0A8S0TD31_OLEEU|nr:DEAD-box ATP-dependent RNA helicase 57 [Olea europaea subsp. europaea]